MQSRVRPLIYVFLPMVLAATFLAGCSHRPLKSSGQCLTHNKIYSPLRSLNRIYDEAMTDQKDKAAPLQLIKDDCWKRIYHRGQYQIVIYQSEVKLDEAAGIIGVIKNQKIDVQQCLIKAEKHIKELNLEFGTQLVSDYKVRRPLAWGDPDIGPVTWLDCNTTNKALWYSSLATFLHEISHSLTQNNCIYMNSSEPACMQITTKPPTAEIARLELYPSQEPKAKAALDFVQNLYLHNHEEFWTFLDEIRAYSITTVAEAAAIEKFGLEGIYQNPKEESSRNYLILPQMLYHLALYLNRFAQQDPQKFKEFWTTHNAGIVRRILEQSQSAMLDWLNQLTKRGSKIRPIENYFWQASQQEMQSFYTKNSPAQEAAL